MKLGILPITVLLLATSVAVPAQANTGCPSGDSQTVCLDQTKQFRRVRGARRDRRDRDYDYYYEINQVYREVLGREIDSSGLRTYSRELENGNSIDDIREDIANSNEARDAVERIYRELVGRSPSRNDVRDYTRRLANGWTLSDIRADIVDSDDFRRDRGRRSPVFQPPGAAPLPVGPGGRPPVPPPPGVGSGGVPPIAPPPIRPPF